MCVCEVIQNIIIDTACSWSAQKTNRYNKCQCETTENQHCIQLICIENRSLHVSVRPRRSDQHHMQLICIENRLLHITVRPWPKTDCYVSLWDHGRKQIVTCHCETMQLICIRLKVRRKQIVTCHCQTMPLFCNEGRETRRKQIVIIMSVWDYGELICTASSWSA